MNESIDKKGQEVINSYLHLSIAGHDIQCPYFKNNPEIKQGVRAQVGKGTPQEITEEAEIIAAQEKIDLGSLSDHEVRTFLINRGLGVDCSGFIVQVFDHVDPAIIKRINISEIHSNPVKRWAVNKLRKKENISAHALTSGKNADRIPIYHDIRSGDMIRTRGGNHVLLVTRVEHDGAHVARITYFHATGYYGDTNGVRSGDITITAPHDALEKQDWSETEEGTDRNYTLEGYIEGRSDSGVFRLRHINTENKKTQKTI